MKCKQHEVNYCVAQDFYDRKKTFTGINDSCKWAFDTESCSLMYGLKKCKIT